METRKTRHQQQKIKLEKQQLDSISQLLTTLAAGFIVIFGLQYLAQDIIAPILLSTFLAILLMPLFRFFRRRNYSRGVSLLLMLGTFIGVSFGIIIFLTYSFRLLESALSDYIGNLNSTIVETANRVGIDKSLTEDATSNINPDIVVSFFSAILGSLGNIVFYFIIIPILSILMILQIDSFPKHLSEKLKKENPSMQRFGKFAESIMKYVVGRFKVNFVTGVLFTVALLIIGVDFPFVWGFLAIIMSFIPYIGLVIAGAPPTLIAFTEGGLWQGLAVILSLVVINLFAENILDPYIQGKSNKISTAAVVIALLFWTWLFGAIGAILAVPLTVLLKIILSDYRETQWIALLMEGNYDDAQKQSKKNQKSLTKKLTNSITRFIPMNGK